jgi:hypothetical protein
VVAQKRGRSPEGPRDKERWCSSRCQALGRIWARRRAGAAKSHSPKHRCASGYSSASLSEASDPPALLLATKLLGCPVDCHLRFGRGATRPQGGGRLEHVLAAGCHPVLRVGLDCVVARPAEDVVAIAVDREDDIVAFAAARPFVLDAAKEEAIVAFFAGQVVPAQPTIQSVVVSAAGEKVVATLAEQELISCGANFTEYAGETVGWLTAVGLTRATVDDVGAPAAKQDVCADSTRDVVPEPAAFDKIVSQAGVDVIEAVSGGDTVALGCAGDLVVFGDTPSFPGVGVLVSCAVALHAQRLGNSAHQQHRHPHRRH